MRKGKGINQYLVPVSDLVMNQWLVGGLNADAHDFTLAVLSNSHIPVTSVNQQAPKLISKSTADTLSQWKTLLSGHDMAHPPATSMASPQSGFGRIVGWINAAGNSDIVRQINTIGAALDPFVAVPRHVHEARQDFSQGKFGAGAIATGEGLLSGVSPLLPFVKLFEAGELVGTGVMVSRSGSEISEGTAGLVRHGMFKAIKLFGTNDANSSQQTVSYVKRNTGGDGATNWVAKNHISGLRLQQQLKLAQASSIFDKAGYLREEIIANSKLILSDKELDNKAIINILSNRGNISNWAKYETRSIFSSSGPYKVHFYYNSFTKETYYEMDYKSIFNHQGKWDFTLTPKFDYEPPRFNKS